MRAVLTATGMIRLHNKVTATRGKERGMTLTTRDFDCLQLLLNLLRRNPWPSSDPEWQLIEAWAEELLKLEHGATP